MVGVLLVGVMLLGGLVFEVFCVFLKFGFILFGGFVVYFGYFWVEFVECWGWLDDKSFFDLVVFC